MRALVDIVPDEILNRKGKAFVARALLVSISRDWANLVEMTQHMVSTSLGIVDSDRLYAALQKARLGEKVPAVTLIRTIFVEGWLRNLHRLGVIKVDTTLRPELTLHASIQG